MSEAKPSWQELGKNLQQYWIDVFQKFRKNGPADFRRHEAELADQHPFLNAVVQLNRGNRQPIIDYLRSDNPISSDDRADLAFYFEGGLSHKPRKGRKNGAEHEAGLIAVKFYKEWKDMNRRHRVTDHGNSDHMKDEAARFVVEDYLPHWQADYETTRENMERGKNRQK